jgi:glycosyltransferase involved in cell wall biosynthesis
VICSEACGASVELVRHLYDGLVVPTEDATAVARAMRWMHEHADELPEMGKRGRELAAPFASEFWAKRWAQLFFELTGPL